MSTYGLSVLAADSKSLAQTAQTGTRHRQRHQTDDERLARRARPALRMDELVMLLRRIWNLHESPIHHEGRFYRMNLTPTGDVGPSSRPIPIVTAGVRHRMCEAAGRVADGLAGTSPVDNHLRRGDRPVRYRQGCRAHRPRPQ